jgi:hypothetical protein
MVLIKPGRFSFRAAATWVTTSELCCTAIGSGSRECKNAVGEQHQGGDEQEEFNDRDPTHGHERGGNAFDEAEGNAANERSSWITKSAEDGYDEAFQLISAARQHGEWK